MREQASINKTAWEYRAYEFWNQQDSPAEKAAKLKSDPLAHLDLHKKYFDIIVGKKVANPCGSNGRKAVPLALLGAEVTVFDISEENKRYALELAHNANVSIQFILGDFCEVDCAQYGNINHQESNKVDIELALTSDDRDEFWRNLSQSSSIDLPGIIYGVEIDQQKEYILNQWYKGKERQDLSSNRFVTLESTKEFIERATDYVSSNLQALYEK